MSRKLLVDAVARKWIEDYPTHIKAVWMHTCWEMYKKVPDEPSRILLQSAIDDVMVLSGGIVMLKIDSPEEQEWLQGKRGI